MELGVIAAVARHGAIGAKGTMPWRLPADLAHFRRTTLGCPVVMGRKTWDSLAPRFRPLPGRRNIVVTRNAAWRAEGAEPAASLGEALQRLAAAPRVFVIGGGELYAQALPRADLLVLTEVDGEFEADTFFPAWDRQRFEEVSREVHAAVGTAPAHAFVTYRRRAA